MSPRNDENQLATAWRALDGESDKAGWRSIRVEQGSCYVLRAGRRLPENLEAILVGVDGARVPADAQLPKGRGFTVARAEIASEVGRSWLALYREAGADQGFFEMMAADILDVLRNKESGGADALVDAVLARVVAWQEFMRRASDGMLSPDEEIGLFGELCVLSALLNHVPPHISVDAWVGPIDGLQDFAFPPGAVEVKTTAAGGPFIARIGSLEQLDTSVIRPLYVAAVRLAQTSAGVTLPDAVAHIRRDLEAHASAAATFEHRLMRAGYRQESAGRYVRCFAVVEVRYLAIEEGAPRLVPANVPAEVRSARYELDLDAISEGGADLATVLKTLGVY